MSFLKDQFLQVSLLWHYQTVTKVNNSRIIDRETFVFPASNVLLDLENTTIVLLSCLDLVFKSRLDFQICKITRRNYFKIQTGKLFMEGRLSFFNHQIITIGFPT